MSPQGPECLWAEAILEDAKRDTEMVKPGPLLDIALIGAVRKLKASEIVAYETAICVARSLGEASALEALQRTHVEEQAFDDTLHRLLDTITAQEEPASPA